MAKISPATSPCPSPAPATDSAVHLLEWTAPVNMNKRPRLDLTEAAEGMTSAGTEPVSVGSPSEQTAVETESLKRTNVVGKDPSHLVAGGTARGDSSELLAPSAPKAASATARMEQLSDFACTAGRWFSITMVPARTEWSVLNGERTTTALAYMDLPLDLWAVGMVQSITVYVGSVMENPTLRLTVELPRAVDRLARDNIIRLAHHDHLPSETSIMRFATHGGERGRQILSRVYDARRRYAEKSKMEPLQITDLRVGDVVLTESWFVRREVPGGCTSSFVLRAVSLLKSKGGGIEDAMEDEMAFPWEV